MCGGSPTAVASCSSQLLPDREFETHKVESALPRLFGTVPPTAVELVTDAHLPLTSGGASVGPTGPPDAARLRTYRVRMNTPLNG